MKLKRGYKLLLYTILSLGALVIALPIYLTIVSTLKTDGEMMAHFFSLPSNPTLATYVEILTEGEYFTALKNTVVITGVVLAAEIVFLPMFSYPIARRMHSSRYYKFLYFYAIVGIFIPFQVKMFPMIKLLNTMEMTNRLGLIFYYLGIQTCEGVFLISGYLASISDELEEAAYIDGASTRKVFFHIVYPLMKPIIATMIIKNGLWVWNDYFAPSLILAKSRAWRTLPLFQYAFKQESYTQYTMLFTAVVLSMLPIMVIYIVAQKQIIGGMMTGAVKG